MAATSSLPPPLACKCEVGVFSHLFYWDNNYGHHHPPRSLQTRVEGFLAYLTQDGCHVIATTPRLQVRGGGVFSFILLGQQLRPPPPPSLAPNTSRGVSCLFYSGRPPRHCYHPPLLASARWGCFLIYSTGTTSLLPPPPACRVRWGWVFLLFTGDGCHITTTIPSCSQTRGRGGGICIYF
jgi:hypothetical protein